MQMFRNTINQWNKDMQSYLYLEEKIRNIDPLKSLRDVVDEWKMYKIMEKLQKHKEIMMQIRSNQGWSSKEESIEQ